MINEHQALAADGVQLAELRLDFLRRAPELHRLLPDRPTATLLTVRRKQDGGLWTDSEENRLLLLRSAITQQPEFIDLEVDIADKIPRYGKTRRIISYHNIGGMPDNIESLHKEMLSKDPDVIKIAVNPKTIAEMFRFIAFVREKNAEAKKNGTKLAGDGNGIRVVGICMGETGKASRILAKKFGMPFTYSTFSESRVIAPGLMVYKEMLDLYHYEQTDADTKVFGIIGNPIGHSLSPLIHNKSFVEQKINAVYVPFPLDSEQVADFVEYAPQWDIEGISVTIPHKVTVMKSLTKMDPAVSKIGACNTVVFKNGEKLGYNTDYLAAVSSIEIAMDGSPQDTPGILEKKNALVLGAGGAGMALVYGLKKRGAIVTVTDINKTRADELAQTMDIEVVDWDSRMSMKPAPEVIANCTPIGMHPNVEQTPFERSDFQRGTAVFDAVYNPENTLFLKNAASRGCTVISGVEMFVGQACLQFKFFTGEKASASFMRKLVKNAISAAKE
jgi:3-dehydroquinate dehydratase/shikimate dehydrogenase